jgi:DNA mismatch repair protein MutL
VLLAFERFATSKIRSAADLGRIQTYGFRGEALPSIAAVSRVTMVTRPRGQDAASRIIVAGGKQEAAGPAGGAEGTAVTVEHLFYNTPARRGFLKSDAREVAVIVETVQALALAAAEVGMRLTIEGREVLWAPAEPFGVRARRILGPELAAYVVDLDGSGHTVMLRGVLGLPQVARTRRTHQWFLVNGRPVRSPLLSRALVEAFRTLIPDDRQPVAVLSLGLDPEHLDVNIHPRKAEVRFVQDQVVFGEVLRQVRRALRETPLAHVIAKSQGGGPGNGVAPCPGAPEAAPLGAVPSPAYPVAGEDALREDSTSHAFVAELDRPWPPEQPASRWTPIRVIGQLGLTYILGESAGDLALVDQHAAHERVLFERLMDRVASGGVQAQGLIPPVAVALDPPEAALVADLGPALRALGWDVEPFGPGQIRLAAVPAIAIGRAPQELFRACLRDLADHAGAHEGQRLEERLAIATACHTAVRAGDRLDPQAMRSLLDELARTRDPFSCFHGRPTVVRVSRRDLERWFYRRM